MRRLIAVAAAALALTGCGGGGTGGDEAKNQDLHHYLSYHYKYKAGEGDSYSGLGTVRYQHGDVTIDTQAWADTEYGSYLYCSWVEGWLQDNGTENSTITVIMDGKQVLRTHNMGESCEDASFNATYGTP